MNQALPLEIDTVRAQRRSDNRMQALAYSCALVVGLIVVFAGFGRMADPFILALAMLIFGGALILVRPILGVYLIMLFSLIGDSQVMDGYPFNLNFSSRESMLYIHDGLTLAPIEVCLALTAVGWFLNAAGERRWDLRGGAPLAPLLTVAAMVFIGLVFGVLLNGGDMTVAIWEMRPVLYLPFMYVLVSNLLTRPVHYIALAWIAVLAIAIQNLFALRYYHGLGAGDRSTLEGLTEHATSVQYAWLFLLTISLFAFHRSSWMARFCCLVVVGPTAYLFILSQRRAAVVAMIAGFFVFLIILFVRRRRVFNYLAPISVLLGTAYTAIFWNATDGIGFGARAVKSVIASDEVSARDSSSNLYRYIENFNLVFTIRSNLLTGVGFGKPFYQPIPLPDISFFVFYEYIPHNSILWIWLKLGFVGFIALLFALACTLRAGTRAALTLPTGTHLAVTVAAMCYVVMYFVFAYVDIAWDTRSTLFLAVCMATCGNAVRVSDEMVEAPPAPPSRRPLRTSTRSLVTSDR